MNKKVKILLLLIVIIFIGGLIFYIIGLSGKNKPSPQDIYRDNIYPLIVEYCQDLETKANQSSCPTCYNPNPGIYEIENSISQDNNGYKIKSDLKLIYGYNDRPGSIEFNFVTDNQGDIISKDMPKGDCL